MLCNFKIKKNILSLCIGHIKIILVKIVCNFTTNPYFYVFNNFYTVIHIPIYFYGRELFN